MRIDRYYTGRDHVPLETIKKSTAGDDKQHSEEWIDDPQVVNQPMLCQHCDNAPCESVCPVYATYHNNEGRNVQVYNRCVGTRFCGNNCPYHARLFNYWEPVWPEDLRNQLNPDVTVRSRGIMEKCTMCVQRIRLASRGGIVVADLSFNPACVQACPTDAMVLGDMNAPDSRVSHKAADDRAFHVLEGLGTAPSVTYLKQVDLDA